LAGFVLQIVDALRASTVDVVPPFIAVAERQQTTVRVRVRTAPPWQPRSDRHAHPASARL
jgi:hypothetical protein